MNEFKHIEPTRDTDQRDQQKLAKKIKNFIYDPSQVIGSGFSSKVYKGINEHNNQQVAIKVIQLSKIQNEVQKYLLNNEINALRALNHKNVLRTIDILMTKNNVYIVTEFCQFGDLQQMIKNNKKLQEKDALNITRDIAEGYNALEQKNIIHRDLKTANIFLTKTGAKIADFGFCEFEGQKKPQISYNVGSPAYMSPESYKDSKYSNKSDIWGIGIILAEMLIGETPEKNLTYTEMSNNLMNGKIPFTQNQDIKQILMSCFRKDVRQRTDAQTLLRNINKAIQKITNYQESMPQRTSQFENRFSKMPQLIPIEQQIQSIPIQRQEVVDNLRFTTEQKKIVSLNPSRINPFRSSGTEEGRQFSIIQTGNIQQGSRTLSDKKNLLQHSSAAQFNTIKQSNQNQLKKLKSNITMLQFVFRLFKYLSEVPIPIFSFIKLILFRHRSHIEQMTENMLQENRIQLSNHELYKEFQFLKKTFDSAYLDRQNSSNEEGSYHDVMIMMNKLANFNFIDPQSLTFYKDLIHKGAQEVFNEITENRSNVFPLWDYLMLEFEILCCYSEGMSEEIIVAEKIVLQNILKEQPKSISKIHIELLKLKHKFIFEGSPMESNEIHNFQSPIYTQNILAKHISF